jgi:hypothetical protein
MLNWKQQNNFQSKKYYIRIFVVVPFEQAIHLLTDQFGNRLYVEGGNAFVPIDKLSRLITPKFRALLSQRLTETALHWSRDKQDERVTLMLKAFHIHEDSSNEYKPGSSASESMQMVGNEVSGDHLSELYCIVLYCT